MSTIKQPQLTTQFTPPPIEMQPIPRAVPSAPPTTPLSIPVHHSYSASGNTARKNIESQDTERNSTNEEFDQAAETLARSVADKIVDTLSPLTPFDNLKASYGATAEEFKQLQSEFGAVFAPSASAGLILANLNDHAGILIVPVRDGKLAIAERLTVLCDEVRVPKTDIPEAAGKGKQPATGEQAASGPETETQTRYFVKGYGDRVISFNEFQELVRKMTSVKPVDDKCKRFFLPTFPR